MQHVASSALGIRLSAPAPKRVQSVSGEHQLFVARCAKVGSSLRLGRRCSLLVIRGARVGFDLRISGLLGSNTGIFVGGIGAPVGVLALTSGVLLDVSVIVSSSRSTYAFPLNVAAAV